ncbi:Receptor expression-enhancing protein 5 [Hondaea fermentalgiana]|uniref:Receptor expression-enhancing protein 5 n=1 Tax=Hondaea fermentalgiana TaxID=2315210 RepID=A0A2R5GPV7_9STRA|nr:Receptor expression-enhancing protein 5 [Hondaea fermentalgiana]|eukprot:GBG30381.1 Receptor expression-enhancing protein 5 [Hondaea fermentalgiana]
MAEAGAAHGLRAMLDARRSGGSGSSRDSPVDAASAFGSGSDAGSGSGSGFETGSEGGHEASELFSRSLGADDVWESGKHGQRLSNTTLASTLLYASSSGAASLQKSPKSLQRRFTEARTSLARELDNYEGLKQLEAATGVRKLDLVSWGSLFVGLSLALGWGARQWCEVVGFAYPAQATMNTLATKDKAQIVRWVTYWVCMSFLNIIELAFGGYLLRIAPFYYPLKIGLSLWLQSRSKRGALYVHSHVLAPFLKCHEAVPFRSLSANFN